MNMFLVFVIAAPFMLLGALGLIALMDAVERKFGRRTASLLCGLLFASGVVLLYMAFGGAR